MAKQKLITKAIEREIPRLYATEDVRDPIAFVKLFLPGTGLTWYLTEYDPKQRLGFGLVQGQDEELAYISVAELESVRGPMGLPVERDMYFSPQPISLVRRARANRRRR